MKLFTILYLCFDYSKHYKHTDTDTAYATIIDYYITLNKPEKRELTINFKIYFFVWVEIMQSNLNFEFKIIDFVFLVLVHILYRKKGLLYISFIFPQK
jgi:hypothetical protein